MSYENGFYFIQETYDADIEIGEICDEGTGGDFVLYRTDSMPCITTDLFIELGGKIGAKIEIPQILPE